MLLTGPPKEPQPQPPAPAPVPQPKSLDDLISEFNIPRQETRQPIAADNPGSVPPGLSASGFESPVSDISDETAHDAGRQIADLISYGTKGACGLISGNDPKQYELREGERRDLTNAYAAVAKKYGFGSTNPIFLAVLLTLLICGPNFRKAFQDRRYNKLKEEQEQMRLELEKTKQDIASLKSQKSILENGNNKGASEGTNK